MTIKNKSFLLSIFLPMIIAFSNFMNSMEGKEPETINLGNKASSVKGPFRIIPKLIWDATFNFPIEGSQESLQNIFDNINEKVTEKFKGLPLDFITIQVNDSSSTELVPSLSIRMQYVGKYDRENDKVKYFWRYQTNYTKEESISSEDQGFKLFDKKLHGIVLGIEKLLEAPLLQIINVLTLMAYIDKEIKNVEGVVLYEVMMHLNFVAVPVG